jgi:cell division protein FtsA
MAKLRKSIVAALDIGTSKIVCLISQIDQSGTPKVIGIGHQVSQGIKAGIVIDVKKAEQSIRSAVGAAEEMAGVNVDHVVVNISGNQQASHHLKVDMPLSGQEISHRDLAKIAEQACIPYREDNKEIIHCIPFDYSLDGVHGIQNPRGMYGNTLGASLHIVNATAPTLFNLANCLAKCHLDIEDYISSSYASALACLTADEKMLGTTLIDFGGGHTSIAFFRNDHLVYVDSIAIGGNHITNDIALGLNISITEAERLKTLHGNVLNSSKDDEVIELSDREEDQQQIQSLDLVNIIRPRVEEMLELIKQTLDKSGMGYQGGKIIITGGGSQLTSLKEFTEQFFDIPVHIGTPQPLEGLAESTKGPAFSTSIGITQFITKKYWDTHFDNYGKNVKSKNPINNLIKWLKENF